MAPMTREEIDVLQRAADVLKAHGILDTEWELNEIVKRAREERLKAALALTPPEDRVYTMEYRPVAYATIPSGVQTTWVNLPKMDDGGHLLRAFPDLNVSEHTFGEFKTSRPLTEAELSQFQIRQVA